MGVRGQYATMMRRQGTILLTAALVVALLAVPLSGAVAASDHNETEADPVAPGERLAGVVGVQNAEVEGDLSNRTYGVRLANAESDAAKADLVAERLAEDEARLADHEARLADLEADREAGTISEGTYRAKVAVVASENAQTERSAAQTAETARGLNDSVLAERGINVTAIEELRANASRLGGPETNEIARGIAGNSTNAPGVGERPGGGPVGPTDGEAAGPADDETTAPESGIDDGSGAGTESDETNGTADGDGDDRSGNGGIGSSDRASTDRGGTNPF